MNCCSGDLALVIAGHDRSLGAMVTCVRLIAPGEFLRIGGLNPQSLPSDAPACWLVEPPVAWLVRITTDADTTEHYVSAPYCADRCLMPVRPERESEMDRVCEAPA